MTGSTLPEKVAQIYYTYGLFCSSHPITAITLALSVVLLCCYPLLNVPLPGNIPTVVNIPVSYNHKNNVECSSKQCSDDLGSEVQLDYLHNSTQKLPYVWVKDRPLLYVHQIVIRIGVSPWNNKLKMWDAFRGPLQEVFRLLETIRNHEDPETKNTLLNNCYQIEGIKKSSSKASLDRVLPEYSCLLLSPANLWQQNLQTFSLDANILNTVFNYQNINKGKASIAEMAFGLQLRDTAIKRYPLRARPRVLQYAVTIFYQHADQRFINSLSSKLREMYPLYQTSVRHHTREATLIYYPGKFNYHELVPLLISFVGLFLYVYFSVRKIAFIKSKLGLAACSVVTIAGSLSMSMGICFYFGFSLSLQGKEIFPYLVIIVGLENILVLTKSVTSTDSRLDVKIRLAQGLSKEGWSITKNLLTEITILTVSLFTFVPLIQEFSIYMIVSLISDYFVQMFFFATVLGIDVSRMEYFPEQKNKLHLKEYFTANYPNWSIYDDSPQRMTKSKSHPRLNGFNNSPTDVIAKRNSSQNSPRRVPKRIRLVNMWARTRFFQRAFMLWMLVWISMIVYNSGVVDYFISNLDKTESIERDSVRRADRGGAKKSMFMVYNNSAHQLVFSPLPEVFDSDKAVLDENNTIYLKHSPHSRPWSRLTPNHWSAILFQYNETLAGKYIVVLPPMLISHRVSPEVAASVRHPDERDPPPLRWQALAAALDPIDVLPEFDLIESKNQHQWSKGAELPIYPSTPMEILLLTILCTISIAVIAYMMAVLYRCVCSRHYAEWRASWSEDDEYRKIIAKQPAVQLVMEAVPLVVAGHTQEVECLVTDGESIVSSCLQGNINVWDSLNGELITNIDRRAYFMFQTKLYDKFNSKRSVESEQLLNIKSPQNPEIVMMQRPELRLRRGILNNHLSRLRYNPSSRYPSTCLSAAENTKYNFAKTFRELYFSDDHNVNEMKENVKVNSLSVNRDLNISTIDRDSGSESTSVDSEVDCRVGTCENSGDWKAKPIEDSPVWCMDFCNDLIVLGCADGRLEFWEASSAKLKCVWWCMERRSSCAGVTNVKMLCGGRRICAALLTGHISLLRLSAYNAASGTHVDWRFSTAYRRTHKRTGSADSLQSAQVFGDQAARGRMSFSYEAENSDCDDVVCVRVAHCRAHQQPITELQSEGGHILTGGQDHVLKVFSIPELSQRFTLHGHCGPITSCFIDHANPNIAGSGSQDGLLCVWDLTSGACLYSVQAHDGAVTSLAYTASYVVSAGADQRLCIWDRFQGHMLNSIHIGLNYMSRMFPLTHTLLVMGDRCGLTAYDLSSGDVIRRVLFGQSDGCIFVRQILPLKDAIVCDYANQLRIVRFPLVSRFDIKNE